jgi:CRP-like cAMP-binding protein
MEETKCFQKGRMRQDVIDLLVYIPLFDQLEADELEIAEKYMNLIEINKDEVLFKEGEKGNYVCFIVDGTLDVVKQSATGESITITELSRGHSIGEMSVMGDFFRSATVKAQTETKLFILTRENFELIMEHYPKTGIKILRGIARLLSLNLRDTSGRLVDYMLPDSPDPLPQS